MTMRESVVHPEFLSRMERLAPLLERWREHCRQAGHLPATEGGKAYYDSNLAGTYVVCYVRACRWTSGRPAAGERAGEEERCQG